MDRPIIFSGAMVRAILEDRKSQTRRPLMNQPIDILPMRGDAKGKFWVTLETCNPNHGRVIRCRYGFPGDRLWVRETWYPVDDTEFGGEKWIDYRATPRYESSHPAGWENAPDDAEALKWRPSIHMPRWASRIILEIVGIRVERLHQIMPGEAIAEGIENTIPGAYFGWADYTGNGQSLSPIMSFHSLWDSINAKRGFGWDTNPWVWVLEFKKVKP